MVWLTRNQSHEETEELQGEAVVAVVLGGRVLGMTQRAAGSACAVQHGLSLPFPQTQTHKHTSTTVWAAIMSGSTQVLTRVPCTAAAWEGEGEGVDVDGHATRVR